METKDGKLAVYAKTRKEWRKWLRKNSRSEKSIWLILFHKTSQTPSVNRIEATEEALCFGWIDSLTKKRDPESFYMTFTPRKTRSTWSKLNRERAAKMIEQDLMTPDGQAMIDLAKSTGRWEPEAGKK